MLLYLLLLDIYCISNLRSNQLQDITVAVGPKRFNLLEKNHTNKQKKISTALTDRTDFVIGKSGANIILDTEEQHDLNNTELLEVSKDCFQRGIDYPRNDLADAPEYSDSAEACQASCVKTAECYYWAYGPNLLHKGGRCWKKNKNAIIKGWRVENPKRIIGPKTCECNGNYRSGEDKECPNDKPLCAGGMCLECKTDYGNGDGECPTDEKRYCVEGSCEACSAFDEEHCRNNCTWVGNSTDGECKAIAQKKMCYLI